ncbi:uncharacterized protein VTP21DRAFT_487 [Calcarisporiella thermophila]|uniref:uncharacterized protein n=1 Tax=Calcarisporiella thermophila TaxID=911321 RepID=UPI0037424F1A
MSRFLESNSIRGLPFRVPSFRSSTTSVPRDPLSARLRRLERELTTILEDALEVKPQAQNSQIVAGLGSNLEDPFPIFSDLLRHSQRKRWWRGVKKVMNCCVKPFKSKAVY